MCHRSLGHLTKSFFLVRMMRSNPPSRRVRVQRVLFFLLTITLTLSLKGQGKANTKSPVLSAVHHSWLDVCNKMSLYFGQHSTCLCMLRNLLFDEIPNCRLYKVVWRYKILAANSYSSIWGTVKWGRQSLVILLKICKIAVGILASALCQ